VDLRRAFYEYEKAKNMESELNGLTEERKSERTGKIEAITKLREEAELLTGDARARKEQMIDAKLTELQAFDRDVRQTLLNKKNDMFREVIDDIQKVVDEIGKKEAYSYILDSRNIMYAEETFDLTDRIIDQLNK
jgi:Skp family chaperone for outer membrane proteins